MIASYVSALNRCHYCLSGHTQGHRQSRVVVITSFLDRWSDAEEVEDLV